jgi:hypothetical protein
MVRRYNLGDDGGHRRPCGPVSVTTRGRLSTLIAGFIRFVSGDSGISICPELGIAGGVSGISSEGGITCIFEPPVSSAAEAVFGSLPVLGLSPRAVESGPASNVWLLLEPLPLAAIEVAVSGSPETDPRLDLVRKAQRGMFLNGEGFFFIFEDGGVEIYTSWRKWGMPSMLSYLARTRTLV